METKEKIMQAMYQSIAKQGYEKTSLSQIAQQVSIQKPSLYYHFNSKEDLLLHTVSHYYKIMYKLDMEKVKSLTTPEDFRIFLRQLGQTALAEFEDDKELQLFYCEINLLTKRIPALDHLFLDLDKEHDLDYIYLFETGIKLGALPQNFDITLEIQSMIALHIGLSELLLYSVQADFTRVWNTYITRLLREVD